MCSGSGGFRGGLGVLPFCRAQDKKIRRILKYLLHLRLENGEKEEGKGKSLPCPIYYLVHRRMAQLAGRGHDAIKERNIAI